MAAATHVQEVSDGPATFSLSLDSIAAAQANDTWDLATIKSREIDGVQL